MNEIFDITTLITIAIAVFILLRLRSVLGKRTGYQHRPEDFEPGKSKSESSKQDANDNDNVIAMPERGKAKRIKTQENPAIVAIDAYAKSGTKLNKGLKSILENIPEFEPNQFIGGARMAYEMIVTAFAEGDKKALKNLLSKEVYDGFTSAIDERSAKGEKINTVFVGIEKSDIKAGEMVDKDAHITVQFISQIISATYDKNDELISGDPEQVVEVNDIWTFSKNTRSKNPNWKLVATESDV